MFLYLDKSLLECMQDPVSHQVIDGLQALAFMLRSGVHLVSGDRDTLAHIAQLEDISSSARAIFRRAIAKHAQASSVLSHMSIYALVDFGREGLESDVEGEKSVIKIPISYLPSLIAQSPTEIVYEDINDAAIYTIVAKWYSGKVLNSPNLPVRSKAVQGGGSRTYATYSAKQDDAETFCLCITDSDRKYPADRPGDTSSKVREIEDTRKPLSFHLDLDFHEIENLVPLGFLDEVAGTDEARNIVTALRRADSNDFKEAKLYWDFKKGLRAHYSKNSEEFKNYWCAALGVQARDCDTECMPNKCECFLIKPWPLKQDLKLAIERQSIMDPSDCEAMSDLWSRIGRAVVSWTVASTPQLT